MADPTVPAAFAAGLLSFLSPCVLPLVPGYLSYMSGFGDAEQDRRRVLPTRPVVVGTAFVLGFAAVFVSLGATATVLGSFLRGNRVLFTRVAGVIVILLGLVVAGLLKTSFLQRELRFHPGPRPGIWGSVVLGAAFAFGWTPCIGATMGAVLTMAAGQGLEGGPAEGAFLLAVYSLGLGVPFVFAGLGAAKLVTATAWLRRHVRIVNMVGGMMLVVLGSLLLTENLDRVSIWMQRGLTALGLDAWTLF